MIKQLSIFLSTLLLLSSSLYAEKLIELNTLNSQIRVDMRYAGTRNPLKQRIYGDERCFLVSEVAEQLCRVERDLQKEGYSLIVWDAYRPYSIEPKLWVYGEDCACCVVSGCICGEDPLGHYRGTAVDVTMICSSGTPLAMPCDFGDCGPRARLDYRHLPAHIYHNRVKLEMAMRRHGFIPSPNAWWHFDYRSWSKFELP